MTQAAATPAGGDTGLPGQALAAEAVSLLIARSETVAVAESLTGGLVTAALTSVAGLLGRVPGRDRRLRHAAQGSSCSACRGTCWPLTVPFIPDVAGAMASGVSARLRATYGLATTGVAGPGPADGQAGRDRVRGGVRAGSAARSAGSGSGRRPERRPGGLGGRRVVAAGQHFAGRYILITVLRAREHAAMPSPARSVRTGTVEGVAVRPQGGERDDGPASSDAR